MDFRPNRFQVLPTVVKNLIIINSLVVVAQYVIGQSGFDLSTIFGLHYWKSHYFHWWQLVTHIFMHGSYNDFNLTFWHLFSNMFALWMFGNVLENMWGSKRFLIFYFVCGIGAAICHLAVMGYSFHAIEQAFSVYQTDPTFNQFGTFLKQHVAKESNPLANYLYSLWQQWGHEPSANLSNESVSAIHHYLTGINLPQGYFPGIFDEATVGASGAVFGVLFAFGYLFPNMDLLIFGLVPVKAKYCVAGYAIFELFSGVRNSAGDNVAHFAHLGGMLFAFILLRIWNNRIRNRFN
jgi:membrane associated rhomboid family serine protease